MKNKIFFKLLLIFAVSNFILSCKEDVDLDKISPDTSQNIGIALPLFYAEVALSDLLKEKPDTIIYNDDKSIEIVYRKDSVVGIKLSDYFEMPEFDQAEQHDIRTGDFNLTDQFFEEKITPEELGIPQNLTGNLAYFPTLPILRKEITTESSIPNIKEAIFASGQLKLTITNNFPTAIEAGSKLKLHNSNGNYFVEFTLPRISPGSTVTSESDLTDKMVTNTLDIVIEDMVLETANNITIDPVTSNLDLRFDAIDMKVKEGLIKFDKQTINGGSKEINLGKGDQKLYHINMQQGLLNVQIYSEIRTNCHIHLTFPGIKDKNGMVKDTTFSVVFDPQTGHASDVNIDFSGCGIDLSKGGTSYNTLVAEYEVEIPQPDQMIRFNSNSKIYVTLNLKEPEFEDITGYVGLIKNDFEIDTINTKIDLLDVIDGGFTLVDPRINLFVENSFGIPIRINLDLEGKNINGNQQDIIRELNINAASIENPTVKQTFSINKDNSNIVKFTELAPEKIFIATSTTANPEGETINYIKHDSQIKLGLELSMPLEIQSTDLFYTDTVEINVYDALPDFIDQSTMEMYFLTENGFPFELKIKVSPYKADPVLGDIFFDDITTTIMDAPEVDNNGRSTERKKSRNVLKLSKNDVENLKEATNMLVRVSMKTSRDGSVPVKLFSDNSLNLKVGVRVDATISNK